MINLLEYRHGSSTGIITDPAFEDRIVPDDAITASITRETAGKHNREILQGAIDAAVQDDGHLHVPAGSYYVDASPGSLKIAGDLSVRGDGSGRSKIVFGPEEIPSPYGLLCLEIGDYDFESGERTANKMETHLQRPFGIAADANLEKLFWTNRGVAAARRPNPSIKRAELPSDGGSAGTLGSPVTCGELISGNRIPDTPNTDPEWERRTRVMEDALGIAVDSVEDGVYVYWIDPGYEGEDESVAPRLVRAKQNARASDIQVLLEGTPNSPETSLLLSPRWLALATDGAQPKIYWTDGGDSSKNISPFIGQANLTRGQSNRPLSDAAKAVVQDVSAVDQSILAADHASDPHLKDPRGIAVSETWVYWADAGEQYTPKDTDPAIRRTERSNVSGGVATVVDASTSLLECRCEPDPVTGTLGAPYDLPILSDPQGLAVAAGAESDTLYWTAAGIPAVLRAEVSVGSGAAQSVQYLVGASGFAKWFESDANCCEMSEPLGVAVVAAKVYWVDHSLPAILRADLDGANPEVALGNPQPISVAFERIHLEGPDDPSNYYIDEENEEQALASRLVLHNGNAGALMFSECRFSSATHPIKTSRDVQLTCKDCLIEAFSQGILMASYSWSHTQNSLEETTSELRPTSDAAACHLSRCTFKTLNPAHQYVDGYAGAGPPHNVYLQRPHAFNAEGCVFAECSGCAIKWHGGQDDDESLCMTFPSARYIQMSNCAFTGKGGALVTSSCTRPVVANCTFAIGEQLPRVKQVHTVKLYKAGITMTGCSFTGGNLRSHYSTIMEFAPVEGGVLITGCTFEEKTRFASIVRYQNDLSEWRIANCKFIERFSESRPETTGQANALYVPDTAEGIDITDAVIMFEGCEFSGRHPERPMIRAYGGTSLTLRNCSGESPTGLILAANVSDMDVCLQGNTLKATGECLISLNAATVVVRDREGLDMLHDAEYRRFRLRVLGADNTLEGACKIHDGARIDGHLGFPRGAGLRVDAASTLELSANANTHTVVGTAGVRRIEISEGVYAHSAGYVNPVVLFQGPVHLLREGDWFLLHTPDGNIWPKSSWPAPAGGGQQSVVTLIYDSTTGFWHEI